MSNNIERYTTELWNKVLNGRITAKWENGDLRISGVEINYTELVENFKKIERFWNDFSIDNKIARAPIAMFNHFDVSIYNGLDPVCESIKSISDIPENDKYYICISAMSCYDYDVITPYQLFIICDNSDYQIWINQGILDHDKNFKRLEEITEKLRSEFNAWEQENVSDEVIKYTGLAYQKYCQENSSYEDFVSDYGYIDGTRNPINVLEAEDILLDELTEYYELK